MQIQLGSYRIGKIVHTNKIHFRGIENADFLSLVITRVI